MLVGAGHSEVSVSPETVPYVFPLPVPVQVDIHHAHDIRAHLIPDGSNLLVSATEMPPVELGHLESPTPLNPLGVKGVGECGVVPIAAAVVSAIEDALSPYNVRITRTPITPADIVALIQR